MLRRIGIIAVLSLIVTALAAVPALAQLGGTPTLTRDGGLHFVGTPTLSVDKTTGPDGSATLTASGEVAGAGTTATATLSADATAVVGCINRGSQGQEPSGLQTDVTPVVGTTTFNTRQGRGTFTVSTTSVGIPEDFNCPDGMTETLVSVTFSNIVLTIESQTGTITATWPESVDP
jgi:hypothetical protein